MLKCLNLQGKHPERLCAVPITQREAAVKQIPLVLDSPSTSQILPAEGCEFVKMVRSTARFGGAGELFLLLFLVQGAPGRAILALLCCSFQRSSLSQENQMRVTSGHGASAKSLLFCSWQEDDVLQMPGSL